MKHYPAPNVNSIEAEKLELEGILYKVVRPWHCSAHSPLKAPDLLRVKSAVLTPPPSNSFIEIIIHVP